MFKGQAEQDKFVLNMLKHKKNGYFLEIGSNHPININNTYLLETIYDWKGIMIEYEPKFLSLYKQHRPNSIHIINDATQINYKSLFEDNNMPKILDYLQIDLEADNGSTLKTLQKLDNEIFDTYKFATITFEHDIYHTNYLNTRLVSRKIFEDRGYVRIFSDINNQGINPYEDWYIHPDLVDGELVNTLIRKNENKYKSNIKTTRIFDESLVNKSINWEDIEY